MIKKVLGKSVKGDKWIYGYYRSNDMGNHFITRTLNENNCRVYEEFEVDEESIIEFGDYKFIALIKVFMRDRDFKIESVDFTYKGIAINFDERDGTEKSLYGEYSYTLDDLYHIIISRYYNLHVYENWYDIFYEAENDPLGIVTVIERELM